MMVGKHQSVYWGKIHWHSTSPLQRPWPSGEQTPWNPNSRSGLPRFICDVSQKEMYHVGACWSHSFGSVLIDVCLSCDSCDLKTTIVSPIEFQVRRCDPWSVCYKKDSQAWGYRMRLLSSIFPQHSLSYKMPLRFNNLDIGGGFPLLQNAPSFSTTVSYKDIRLDKPAGSSSCHATKRHCDSHDALTWLKWLLYQMRFTSLSYKVLDLDFISGLAWLTWKPLYSVCGHKFCNLKS